MGAYLSKPGVNKEAGIITVKSFGSSPSGAIGLSLTMRIALLQKVMSSVIFGFFVDACKIRSKINLNYLTMASQAPP